MTGAFMNGVTICICTYRRHSLRMAIETASRQDFAQRAGVDIVVVDNDHGPSAKSLVDDTAAKLNIHVRYIHAPARNIAVARNAALNAVRTKWLAFLDDDEVAARDWLSRLMAMRAGKNVVIGRSIAVYGDDAPKWARMCDFHSNRITGPLENAYTSNVLIDVTFVREHGATFPEHSGQTGGEDTLFFRELKERGASFAYCPESVVYEEVHKDRASMKWIFKRKYRFGQTHATMLARYAPSTHSRLIFTATLKALIAIATSIVLLPFHYSWRRWAARAALHVGALSGRIGVKPYREYVF